MPMCAANGLAPVEEQRARHVAIFETALFGYGFLGPGPAGSLSPPFPLLRWLALILWLASFEKNAAWQQNGLTCKNQSQRQFNKLYARTHVIDSERV